MAKTPLNPKGLFTAAELEIIEHGFRDGISSQEVISLFQDRSIKLSEATFRKYIQLGLLSTSRRVGRKGKHRGSKGVYPVSVVRRINIIKRMMMDDMTLEEIRDSFLSVQNELEKAQEVLSGLFLRLQQKTKDLDSKNAKARAIVKEIKGTKKQAENLIRKVDQIQSKLAHFDSKSLSSEKEVSHE